MKFSKLGIFVVLFSSVQSNKLKLSNFGFCFIRLNYFDTIPFNNVTIAGDIFDEILTDNRGSVFMLETTAIRKSIGFLKTQLFTSKCVLYVAITVPLRHLKLTRFEDFILSGSFAYQAYCKTSFVIVWPITSVKFPVFKNCRYRIISARIFALVLELSYNVVPYVEYTQWGFYCHLCSGRVWISLREVGRRSKFAKLIHLSLRRRLDHKKVLFHIFTSPNPTKLQITGC